MAYLDKSLPKRRSSASTKVSRVFESLGWEAGYSAAFGEGFVSGLAEHHKEAINWHWDARLAFLNGEYPEYDAYFPIWSRGHNKSGVARRVAVTDGILSFQRNTPAYILYLSRNKDMALKHAKSIETLLQSRRVKSICPEISEVQRNDQKRSKGWTASFIYTKANVIFHFAGIDEGLAGGNIETNIEEDTDDLTFRPDVRVSLFVPDDIDGREDSPVIAESRFKILTEEVLPMGQDNSLVFFAQNLISRYSVMYRIQKQHVRVLTGRKPTKPIPAVLNLVTKVKTVDGIVRDMYVSGEPTWPVWDASRIQHEINRFGLPSFERECQHNVEQDTEGLVLKNWHDKVHVISYSEFESIYGTRDIPQRWGKRVFNDWARTKTKFHANVAGIVTTSSQNSRMPGLTFLFHPMSFPAGSAPEDVAERLLSVISPKVKTKEGRFFTWKQLITSTLQKTDLEKLIPDLTKLINARRSVLAEVLPDYVRPILRAQHYNDFRGSHEQSKTGALWVYQRVFGLPFSATNPGGDGGVDSINLLQTVDYEQEHPFRPGVEGLGRTNFYVVTDDDRSQTPVIIDGVRVYPPKPYNDALIPDELHDADLFRYQAVNCRFRDPQLTPAGEKDGDILKLNDDFLNGLMFLFYDSMPQAVSLTEREKIIEATPEEFRYETLLAQSPHENGLLPEQELTHIMATAEAKRRLRVQRVARDEFGNEIG